MELLDDGVDVCCHDDKKRSPLHFASSQGYEAIGESDSELLLIEKNSCAI